MFGIVFMKTNRYRKHCTKQVRNIQEIRVNVQDDTELKKEKVKIISR